MALQTTALDRMFEQTLPKRRGTKEPRRPHGVVGVKCGIATLTGTQSLVRASGRHDDMLGRRSRYAASRLDARAGRA